MKNKNDELRTIIGMIVACCISVPVTIIFNANTFEAGVIGGISGTLCVGIASFVIPPIKLKK